VFTDILDEYAVVTMQRELKHKTITTSRQAFLAGISTGLKTPTGCRPYFVIVRASQLFIMCSHWNAKAVTCVNKTLPIVCVNNKGFKIKQMETFVNVIMENWNNYRQHVMTEEETWKVYKIRRTMSLSIFNYINSFSDDEMSSSGGIDMDNTELLPQGTN
jgi:hypothetical protein